MARKKIQWNAKLRDLVDDLFYYHGFSYNDRLFVSKMVERRKAKHYLNPDLIDKMENLKRLKQWS